MHAEGKKGAPSSKPLQIFTISSPHFEIKSDRSCMSHRPQFEKPFYESDAFCPRSLSLA